MWIMFKNFKILKSILESSGPLFSKKFKHEIKRGCSEFAVKYPNYKDISYDMTYPSEWSNNEEKSDNDNFKDGVPVTRNTHKSLSGLTLSDFLIFNKWLNH